VEMTARLLFVLPCNVVVTYESLYRQLVTRPPTAAVVVLHSIRLSNDLPVAGRPS